MPERVRTILILVVSTVWAANFVAPIFIRGFEANPSVHVVFMAIIGALVTGFKSGKGEDDKGGGEKKE